MKYQWRSASLLLHQFADKKKVLEKLHKQFAHPSKSKLKALMTDAKVWDEDFKMLAENLYDACEVCHRFKKTPARPVACLPMSVCFNDAVAMDLKYWRNKHYILYLIDMYSRFPSFS